MSNEIEVNLDNYVELALATESKSFDEIKKRVSEEDAIRLSHAVLGICSEAGELADALKRPFFYGSKFDKVNFAEELGDVLWYIAIACDCCGVSFQEVMQANINKLSKRYPEKFTSQNALKRNLNIERSQLETDID